MNENTEAVKSVRSYRHAARKHLAKVRETLPRAPEFDALREALNGPNEQRVAGRKGLSQEEQVERMNATADFLRETNFQTLFDEAMQAYQTRMTIGVVEDAVASAIAALDDGATVAAERDFDAWQEQKAQTRASYYDSYTYDED